MNTKSISHIVLKVLIAAALLFSTLPLASPALAQTTCQSPVTVVRGDTLFRIAVRCGTTVSALMRANPDIKDRSKIFPGQKIVLPGAILPGDASTDIYIVSKGDTLTSLAKRFNTSANELYELNKADIANRNLIYEGQRLIIPTASTTDPSPGQSYTIRRGDTLRKIAARFGTTVDVLLKLNPSITDPNKIITGQKLVLPSTVQIYTVVRGDTLRKIAARFDTTVQELLELNPDIKDADIIYVGQVLRIS